MITLPYTKPSGLIISTKKKLNHFKLLVFPPNLLSTYGIRNFVGSPWDLNMLRVSWLGRRTCQRGSLGVSLHSCSCRSLGVCQGANREGGCLALILSKQQLPIWTFSHLHVILLDLSPCRIKKQLNYVTRQFLQHRVYFLLPALTPELPSKSPTQRCQWDLVPVDFVFTIGIGRGSSQRARHLMAWSP